MLTVGLFLAVFLPMLVEWRRSMVNEQALRQRGGIEARDDVYALMSLAYPGGFLAMIAEGYLRGASLQSPWLPAGVLVFVAGKALKYWAIATLGPFWSFRVIVVPGAPRVVSGPYRWMRHPNYVGIVGELLGVALMALAWVTGPLAIAAFSLLLWRRMTIENAALEQLSPGAILRAADVSSSSGAPRWARAVDVLCLALLVLAIVVAYWGGFRERVGGIRIALTSPYRLLLITAVIAALRHWLAPGAPIYRDLPARLAAGWRTPASKIARAALLGTRPTMLLIGYFAVVTVGYGNGGRAPLRFSENEFMNLQGKWDTAWYMSIVTDGYRYRVDDPTQQQNIVFFPALPVVTRAVGRLFGGASTAYLWGGTLVVLMAFFLALVYVYRLALDFLGDDADKARWAVWALAAYPFAVFYSALYTESLFLVGAAGAFYHFRRREFMCAAAWGLLVGLTRPNGCFLSIPLALVAFHAWLPASLAGGRTNPRDRDVSWRTPRVTIAALAAAAAPGVGVLLYSAFVWNLTGDPLAWAEGHAAWGRRYSGLLPLASRYYGYMAESGLYIFTKVLPFDTLNALGALFVLATAVPVWRRFGLPYAVFILINLLPPLAAGGFLSAGRLSAVLFPAFIWLAAVVPAPQRPAWLGSFMAVQALNAVLFYTWHELY